MKIMMEWFTKYSFILIVLFSCLWAGYALLHPGLPPTHDGEYHVIRFYEFDKVLRNGDLYPRWAPDLNFGYGVPLFTYVYPLPNYVASLLHFVGIGFIDSLKLNMFLATICGGIFLYLWSKEFWGKTGGLVSSLFYTFSPYHFVDIYVRGSVGEVWALGLFPLWLWSYTKFARTKKMAYFLCSTISLSLIIFSHNILALMFFIFIPAYMVFFFIQAKQKKILFLTSISSVIVALGLSSIFWLPALAETKYVEGLQIYNLQKNFPDLFQLLFPSWGTGFFDNNLTNQMSVQIGVANLFAVFISLISFLKNVRKDNKQKNVSLFFLIAFMITFFLLTPFSTTIWNTVPLLHYFQFPWRLLSLMILICSFLAGSFFYKKRSIMWVLVFLGILFLTTYDYAHPAFYHLRSDNYYTSRSNFIDGTNSPGNAFQTIWTPVFSERAKQPVEITEGEGTVKQILYKPTRQIIQANLQKASNIQFAIAYFPSWTVVANKKQIAIENNDGLLSIHLPKGNYEIAIFPTNTVIETIASIITLFSFLLITGIASMQMSFVRKKTKFL